MIPDGDRRHGTESRRIEDKVHTRFVRHDDIVRVLVLGQDLRHGPRRRLRPPPREDIGKRALTAQLGCQVGEDRGSDRRTRSDGDFTQSSIPAHKVGRRKAGTSQQPLTDGPVPGVRTVGPR